ncbi:hypothetical protein, partial [Stenotrophomonas maltophilia]|uniref:hypothetical protein n=1 Tax=Stenotrophomonas maltophilia TaxID=40324 RepID=UPI001952C8F0
NHAAAPRHGYLAMGQDALLAMIRFALRLVGFVLIALGFIALVIDGTKSIAGGRLIYTVIGETWRTLHLD